MTVSDDSADAGAAGHSCHSGDSGTGTAPREQYKLVLFVTGSTSRSTRAIDNLRHLCEEHLKGQYDLEVIDVYQNPDATKELQVVATPTLVKVLPEPLRRILGDLSDKERVLAGLNLMPIRSVKHQES